MRSAKEARTARLWGLVGFAVALARCRRALAPRHRPRWRTTSTSTLGYLLTGWIGLRPDRARPLLLVPGGPVGGHAPRQPALPALAQRCSGLGHLALPAWAPRWRASWAPPSVPRLAADGPLPGSAGPALPGAQLVDLLRLPAGALRHRAVARPRAHARAQRDHLARRTWRRSSAAWPRCARRSTRTASRSRRTTRTCTWRSSAGSPRSWARPAASSTPRARATTRWPPTWRCWCARTALSAKELLLTADGHPRGPGRAPPRLAAARATPTSSAPSPSTSRTTCSPTSGSSAATSSASTSA